VRHRELQSRQSREQRSERGPSAERRRLQQRQTAPRQQGSRWDSRSGQRHTRRASRLARPNGFRRRRFLFPGRSGEPTALRWKLNDGDALQVVKITFPENRVTPRLEEQLAESKHAAVYGIYFDTASARIRPESESVLAEISGILHKNP